MVHFVQLLNSIVTSGAEAHATACGEESMYNIVISHVTDTPFLYHVHPHGISELFGNLIFKLNTILGFHKPDPAPVIECLHGHAAEVINATPIKLLGIFDLRITKWVLMLWMALFLCALVFIPLARKIKNSPMGSTSRWVNLWESLIGFVHDEIVEPNFEHDYAKKAMPYFCTVFFFILFANYLGLIPMLATSTGNLAVTAGLAMFTLFGMFAIGTIKQGPLWIFSGIVPHGIPFLMYFLLWPIEVMGLIIKPFALTVRLFANMTAGHIVIVIFLYLVMMFQSYLVGVGSVSLSLIIYLLELLVAFIQAYIFTSLSAMFIGSSMHAH
ncbi:MAG TPA: F0F1 ATP synthase subunit A [Spirochaetota bacterium]|nr:F0F1 ATP synthase subunit A [Spirochaetota bacterium]HPJ35607.1 F0F1 ATP synthase subunit A [Spirochaetota bacterium]